jgi:hypothetical protein
LYVESRDPPVGEEWIRRTEGLPRRAALPRELYFVTDRQATWLVVTV